MARVENVQVTPTEAPARVVLNSRTGSVVMNSAVTLREAAVAHGSLSIMIDTQFGVSNLTPLARARRLSFPTRISTLSSKRLIYRS